MMKTKTKKNVFNRNNFYIDWDEIRKTADKTEKNEAECNVSKQETSLQEAFLKYRKKRQVAMMEAGKMARKSRKKNRNARKCCLLRMKFIEQCMSYIGVPYKKKFHEKGTPEYNSPLFLDCCGLVRRAVRDLKEDFGFEIGPWNQAYMYDTLPKTILNMSQMKPGDLVFITGRYFNEKMRRQLHDVVHVEVWLGDGTKTIGARWHKGCVQVFDDYRFESKSYHSMRYHFKSIQPWLQGECESCCHLHAWRRLGDFKASKKSIFHVKSDTSMPSTEDGDQPQDDAVEQSDTKAIYASDDEIEEVTDQFERSCQVTARANRQLVERAFDFIQFAHSKPLGNCYSEKGDDSSLDTNNERI